MSCKNKKTATDNQWAGNAVVGKTTDHVQKTEFSNEWASSHLITDAKPSSKHKK